MTAYMDNLSDKLQSQVLGNLTNLTDFRNCRLVSQKWKRNVVEACRNKFHVVYPLTDSTLYTIKDIKETKISFDIYAFTGKEKTSGIEPLMQTTEWLQFTGTEVSISEIRKFLGLAHVSLKMLSFKCIKKDLVYPFLKMQENFNALRKISLGYFCSDIGHDTFNDFTNTLEKWNSLDCSVQLPLLESIELYFNGNVGGFGPCKVVTTEDNFRNYIAIAKLMLKYQKTLKEVQIERAVHFGAFNLVRVVQPEWAEMERGLEALDDLNLNRIKVSNSENYINGTSLSTETEMSGRPKGVKNILFNNLLLLNSWDLLIATLSSFKNLDVSYLTSIKISLFVSLSRDPTMVINLEGLKECKNLRTLCLNITITHNATKLVLRNLELLPKGISTLHFENIHHVRYAMGMEILLSQQQMRWIIDNLRDLKSFRTSLATAERVNANENNEQIEVAGANNNEGGNNAQRQQQEERMNRLVNINLDTFRDLLAMPKLKDLKLDMMTARSLSFAAILGPWDDILLGEGTTLDDVREYSDLCQAAGYTSTTTTRGINQDFGTNHIFGYATLTVQRNQK